jgi:hypothetical protein
MSNASQVSNKSYTSTCYFDASIKSKASKTSSKAPSKAPSTQTFNPSYPPKGVESIAPTGISRVLKDQELSFRRLKKPEPINSTPKPNVEYVDINHALDLMTSVSRNKVDINKPETYEKKSTVSVQSKLSNTNSVKQQTVFYRNNSVKPVPRDVAIMASLGPYNSNYDSDDSPPRGWSESTTTRTMENQKYHVTEYIKRVWTPY